MVTTQQEEQVMSHELVMVNGVGTYAGRQPGWHRLGTVSTDLDYDEAMLAAHLAGRDVAVEPLYVPDPADPLGTIEVPGYQLVTHLDPQTAKRVPLSVVGERYTVVQFEQSFGVAPFLEDLGAHVETAGLIRGGRQAFMTLAGRSFIIDPDGANDAINGYLLLTTSHDGSLATEAQSTQVRVQCANMLDYAMSKNTPRAYKVRHTAKAGERLAVAQQILVRNQRYQDVFAAEALALFQTPMKSSQFVDVITKLYTKPEVDRKGSLAKWENKIDLIGDLFSGGGDIETTTQNIAGTAWAGLNAAIERIDWHRKARGGDGTTLLEAQLGLNPNTSQEKAKLHSLFVEWAKGQNAPAFDRAAKLVSA
jgi:phage/plasmid-like protein (TIGR03299 family)